MVLSCSKDKKNIATELKVNYLDSPSAENSAQPFLFAGKDVLFMSWTEKLNDSLAILKYSMLTDTIWSESKEIARGSNWFVNWADFPAIAENKGKLLSHFLQKSANETYTYDIRLKLFDKGADKWQDDFILHNDGTQSEHGFVTILPYNDDSFFVTWLDGRNTSVGQDHQVEGAMTLRAATILSDRKIIDEIELDARTCDCCQTSAAITQNGPIVVYRDRSDEEIRDINIVRSVNSKWTDPQPIFTDNWKIEGCPVNGPKAASFKNNLAIAWYTAAEELPSVKLIFSNDNGVTFETPIVIDEIKTIGRVDVAFIDINHVLMTWVSSEDGQTVIKAIKVRRDGVVGHQMKVADFDPSRSSGFPQIEILKDKAYFAWTDSAKEERVIKTAYINLKNL